MKKTGFALALAAALAASACTDMTPRQQGTVSGGAMGAAAGAGIAAITGGNAWRNYRVTVDQVETLTGYDFFSNVPRNTHEYIESKRDTQ